MAIRGRWAIYRRKPHQARGSRRSAIAAILELFEEITLTERAHRHGEMRHAKMFSERVCKAYEAMSLIHAK